MLIQGLTSLSKVQIQAHVIHSLCETFIRRNKSQDWIIGTLVGHIENGIANISNCCPVVLSEQDHEITRNVLHQHYLVSHHHRIFEQDYLVGWYSLGKEVAGLNTIIQNHRFQESLTPILLTLGSVFPISGLSTIHLYTLRAVKLGGVDIGKELLELPKDIVDYKPVENNEETVSFNLGALQCYSEGMEDALYRLRAYVYASLQYILGVCDGKKKCENDVGKEIESAITSIVKVLTKNEVKKALSNAYIQNLAVIYVATLIKMQLNIAELIETKRLPRLIS
jgi:hypothetical protein